MQTGDFYVVVVLVIMMMLLSFNAKDSDLESSNGGNKDGRSATTGFKKRNTSLANVG